MGIWLTDWLTSPSREELHRKIKELKHTLLISREDNIALQKQVDSLKISLRKKEKVMANGANICEVLPLNGRIFIVESKPGREKDFFVTNGGQGTYEATMKKAQELAAQYPSNTYIVIGPLATMKASIPVVTTVLAEIKPEEKVDTEKKD